MKVSTLAGKQAESNMLVNIPRLITAYYTGIPDPGVRAEKVSFGTSGHRDSSFKTSFNENQILAMTQAICFYRKEQKIDSILTDAPCNNAQIGGVIVVTKNGWFTAGSSGTEDMYKMYAESFLNKDHLNRIMDEAQIIVDVVLKTN